MSDLELTRTIELRTSSPFNEMDESDYAHLRDDNSYVSKKKNGGAITDKRFTVDL